MCTMELRETISRIVKMEACYDALLQADPAAVYTDEALRRMCAELVFYYESGQWLADYACDERGELPRELKRGVLSQDGVFDLLTRIACEQVE